MRYWFIPTRGGDVRLEDVSNDPAFMGSEVLSALTVEGATDDERRIVDLFIPLAVERQWLARAPALSAAWKSVKLLLCAPVREVGRELGSLVFGDNARTWTALRYSSGKIELVDGLEAKPSDPEQKQEIVAAATVRAPERGCPAPEPCAHRASEVLKAFSSRTQWDQWGREGRMVAHGNVTGRAYFVHHRNAAAARGLGHSVTKVSGGEICVWDANVPAEEEALAAKLAIEHREAWLLENAWDDAPGLRGGRARMLQPW